MATLALLISIIALILSYLAYTRCGGSKDELRAKIDDLGITTENLRKKTADALNRLEKSVRGNSIPTESQEASETVEGEIVDEGPKKDDDPRY
jgi:hypothetical protein